MAECCGVLVGGTFSQRQECATAGRQSKFGHQLRWGSASQRHAGRFQYAPEALLSSWDIDWSIYRWALRGYVCCVAGGLTNRTVERAAEGTSTYPRDGAIAQRPAHSWLWMRDDSLPHRGQLEEVALKVARLQQPAANRARSTQSQRRPGAVAATSCGHRALTVITCVDTVTL